MLLADFKAIMKIDNQINDLHTRIATLYRTRATYIDGAQIPAPARPTFSLGLEAFADESLDKYANWADKQYAALKALWAQYDVRIPAKKQLQTKLKKAEVVIQKLVAAHPEYTGKFEVMLVPPAAILNTQTIDALRMRQSIFRLGDHFDNAIVSKDVSKAWRVLVVYGGVDGLNFGDAKNILDTKAYKMAGFDMRALGIREYMAFSLQSDFAVDTKAWSLLLKGSKSTDAKVVSVACVNGIYRYEIDDIQGLGDESFRPAVEIKA